MTLHQFFKEGNLSVAKKEACQLGEQLSQIHLTKYGKRPPKTIIPEINHPINDYPEVFISGNVDLILQFLTEKYTTKHG